MSAAGEQVSPQSRMVRAVLEDADPGALHEAIQLWICIGAPDAPVARVPLRKLLMLGGERPLNLDLRQGQRVWIKLVDPRMSWPAGARLLVELG